MLQQAGCAPVDELKSKPEANTQPSGLLRPRLISIRATVTGLRDPLLFFALLQTDPLPAFQQFLETTVPVEEPLNALSAMSDAWMKSFTDIREDQFSFVCAWSSVPGAPPRVVQTAQLLFGIATPGPYQKRWLTTLPVMRQDELVAWCVEIDMSETASGSVAEVVLCEENMLVLGRK